MHTEGIENGESSDRLVATFYNPCTGIINANGYLRVIQDAEGCDMETRIDHETLEAAGWFQKINERPIYGIRLITDERNRQISVEGWDGENDDQHKEGQLAYAGAAYALLHALRTTYPPEGWEKLNVEKQATQEWPWEHESWKPSDDPIRNLVKAGALIAAEIDRLNRLSRNSENVEPCRRAKA